MYFQTSTPSALFLLLSALPSSLATVNYNPLIPAFSFPNSSPLLAPDQYQNISSTDPLVERQAQGQGVAATVALAATQFPTTSVAASMIVAGGSTTTTYVMFTQTFAATPLGTWALGPTPGVGTIGLGSIAGTVGGVKSKRAEPTAAARV